MSSKRKIFIIHIIRYTALALRKLKKNPASWQRMRKLSRWRMRKVSAARHNAQLTGTLKSYHISILNWISSLHVSKVNWNTWNICHCSRGTLQHEFQPVSITSLDFDGRSPFSSSHMKDGHRGQSHFSRTRPIGLNAFIRLMTRVTFKSRCLVWHFRLALAFYSLDSVLSNKCWPRTMLY